MIQIRLRPPCRREFDRSVYRPGVISLTRLVWGSIGCGLFLLIVAILSQTCQVPVLYPPLAATCFIDATCVYLRVARPKQIIVGHFVSAVGGLLAILVFNKLVVDPDLAVPFKLGLAVAFAAVLMQVFDADHPPAAATAAIPAILPLPVAPVLLPLHMAWGGVIVALFSVAWNRPWFNFPAPEGSCSSTCLGIHMERREALGVGMCILAFALMALKPFALKAYRAGLITMLLGALVLMVEHFLGAELVVRESTPMKEQAKPVVEDSAKV
jgi:hypothetical protein